MGAPKTIYCSGPLFSPEEVAAMERIAAVLEDAGHATFLPHRDGVEAWAMPLANGALDGVVPVLRDAVDRAIFAVDVFQIVERCDALVMNANGRVPDEGAVAEAGIAFASGRPVVLYKRDARSVFNGRDNAMLTGLAAAPPVGDAGELSAAVERALAGAEGTRREAPPALARVVRRGRRLWEFLRRAPRPRTPAGARELLEALAVAR